MAASWVGLLVCVVCVAVVCASDPNAADLVTDLPGQPAGVTFKQYAGYITVDEANGRNLFYWFTESKNDPKNDPLLVWYQGGPGCSGMLGFLTENGAFLPDMESLANDLVLNPYSWNGFANTLFIDSPAGVGYSYSNTQSDYTTDNNKTAMDNYVFLQLWLQKYTDYANSKLWLAGESYAGDYIPQLVQQILTGSSVQLRTNLVGFMIGNPVMSCDAWKTTARDVLIEMKYWHGLISYQDHNEWLASGCTGTSNNPTAFCTALYERIEVSIGKYDADDLYMNFCSGNATLDFASGSSLCISIDQRRNTYLNTADVQTAIHAVPRYWVECTNATQLNYTTDWPNMIPYYLSFFEEAPYLRILIYSGDVDVATVPHAYTQLCLQDLDQPVVTPWHPWHVEGRTAGYVQTHPRYTYATLKGSGHEAPEFTPLSAYEMAKRFVFDELR